MEIWDKEGNQRATSVPLGLLVNNVILAKSHNKCIIYFDAEK